MLSQSSDYLLRFPTLPPGIVDNKFGGQERDKEPFRLHASLRPEAPVRVGDIEMNSAVDTETQRDDARGKNIPCSTSLRAIDPSCICSSIGTENCETHRRRKSCSSSITHELTGAEIGEARERAEGGEN